MDRPSALTDRILIEAAQNYLNSSSVPNIVRCSVSPASAELLGFAADHSKVTLSVSLDDDDERNQSIPVKFFAKIMPLCSSSHEQKWCETAFRREVNFYGKIFPAMMEHFDDFSGGSGGVICHCYLSQNGLLLLEDLSLNSFKISDVRDTMDEKQCTVVLESLARFHASSIVFEEKETSAKGKPCTIGDLWKTEINQDFAASEVDQLIGTWMMACANVVEKVAEMAKPEVVEVIRAQKRKLSIRYLMMRKPSEEHRNVICQADMWANNILFRFSEDGGEPTAVKFVDFQLIQYSPPTYDVLSFIYLSTSRNFRRSFMEKLLFVYYRALTKELNRCCLNADDCGMSWDRFLRSCKDQEYNARLTAMFIHPQVLLDGKFLKEKLKTPEDFDQFFNVDRTHIIAEAFHTDKKYRDRLIDTLEEFSENCL